MAECSSEELARALTDRSNLSCLSRGEAIGLTVGFTILIGKSFPVLLTFWPVQLTFIDISRSWFAFLARHSVCGLNHRGK